MLYSADAIIGGLGEIADSKCSLLAGFAAMTAGQVAFIYVPSLNAAFHSSPLGADSWLRLIAVAFGLSMILGFEKARAIRPYQYDLTKEVEG